MIQGVEQPDSGEVVIGKTAQLAFVDQSRDAWPPTRPCGRTSPAGWTTSSSASS
jgi:ATPase subunit of ABC transporter with duplicated ATPase domains